MSFHWDVGKLLIAVLPALVLLIWKVKKPKSKSLQDRLKDLEEENRK